MMIIREANNSDFDAIWPIFQEVVAPGTTYTFDPRSTIEQAYVLWMEAPRMTFVAEDRGEILGTYFIKTNQGGHGRHVCNCGYMVASRARGQGLASAMCEHSQEKALELGYKAMQFNFVVSSNVDAIRLWHRHGFETVGRLPKAFENPEDGFVDALVMYKWLPPD